MPNLFRVQGLAAEEEAQAVLLLELIQLRVRRYYTARQLSQALRLAYGTCRLSKITYTLQPLAGDSARLVLDG